MNQASQSSRPTPLARIFAILAGSVVVALIHATAIPHLTGLIAYDFKLIVTLAGNLFAGGLLSLIWLFRDACKRRTTAQAFWGGFGFCLAPILTGWLFFALDLQSAVIVEEIGTPVLGLIAGLALSEIMARSLQTGPPMFVLAPIVIAAVAGLAALGMRVGVPKLPPDPHPKLGAPGESAIARAEHPDVILFSVDTLRADAIADPRIETPVFDQWRADGLSADYALAPASMTLPSHATMLSGKSPLFHGAWSNTSQVPEDLTMMAEHFQHAGWRTVAVISNRVLRASNGFARGFEVYAPVTPKPDVEDERLYFKRKIIRLASRAGSWFGYFLPNGISDNLTNFLTLRREIPFKKGHGGLLGNATIALTHRYLDKLLAGEAPYFMFCHFMDPHAPYQPDKTFAGKVTQGRKIPEAYRDFQVKNGIPTLEAVHDDLTKGIDYASEAADYLHDVYLEETLFIDQAIGDILEKVRASGRPTVLLFTSDHGEHFGEHTLMGHGNSVFEEVLRVPFLLSGPGVPKGVHLDVPPTLEDVAPTLFSLAGVPVPQDLDGRVLIDNRNLDSNYWSWMREKFAYREGKWKLEGRFKRFEDGYREIEAIALYDMSTDPEEQRNLLEQESELGDRLLVEARERLAKARIGMEVTLTEEFAADLAELGYADQLQPVDD